MIILPVLLYLLSVFGLVLLFSCIGKLSAPFTGWKYVYNALTPQAVTNIPKAGQYSIAICRVEGLLLKKQDQPFLCFPSADFKVTRVDTNEQIPYYKCFGVKSKDFNRVTIPVGYFDAPDLGKYLITSLTSASILQGDSIVIQKHLPALKFVLLILGIFGSIALFIAGIIIGTMFLRM